MGINKSINEYIDGVNVISSMNSYCDLEFKCTGGAFDINLNESVLLTPINLDILCGTSFMFRCRFFD